MKCNKLVMKITGYLHILALGVSILGTYKQIESIKRNVPYSPWLSISLVFMLLLRIPSQICVSLSESHGWFTVIGTLMGATGFSIVAYMTYKKQQEEDKKQQEEDNSL